MSEPARSRPLLERRSSGELVAHHLRRQIISGQLGAGQRLTQEDIAAELGTSRVPVREALVILEQEGWVKMEMHRGGFVLPIETSVSDNAEVWDLVFGLIARRAVARMSPEFDAQLARLADELAGAKAAAVPGLCEDYLDMLFEGASAPSVARTVRRTRATSIDAIIGIAPETIEISRAGTLAIIKAIRDRDAHRANSLHEAMQRECLDLLLTAIKKRDG